MTHSTFTANYFDGHSTTPKVVQIAFNVTELHMYTADHSWSKNVDIENITFVRSLGADRIVLSINSGSSEAIDITFEGITAIFKEQYPAISNKKFSAKVKGISNRSVLLLLAFLIGLMVCIYFFVVPFFGEASIHLISKENEVKLGEQIYDNVMQAYTMDSEKTVLVNRMIAEIDFQTPYTIEITVVNYNEKNAFALPGGHIVIFSDLLNEMHDYPELMGLLAHEVSHVNLQHSLRAIFRNLASSMFISMIFSDVNGISALLIENADKFTTLSFSRKLEEQADTEGLEILLHNQIDPQGMVRLFKILMKEEKDVSSNLEFMSSHPLTHKRIAYIESRIAEGDYNIQKNATLDSLWRYMKAEDF